MALGVERADIWPDLEALAEFYGMDNTGRATDPLSQVVGGNWGLDHSLLWLLLLLLLLSLLLS